MSWFNFRKADAEAGGPPFDPPWLDETRQAIHLMRAIASRARATAISPEIMLLGLLEQDRFESVRLLSGLGIRAVDLSKELSRGLKPGAPASGKARMEIWSGRSRKSLEGAMKLARELKQAVSTAHLLWAIADDGSAAGLLLRKRGATPDQIRARLRRDAAPEVQLDIAIDDSSDQQIYDQIVSQVREAVATSKLKPGDRLPAIRRLADQLGIAPGTVARAYAELETAQVIITDGPKGTYIAEPPLPTPPSVRPIAMRDLFRPVVVAAFHLGASAGELRKALEEAMTDIYPNGEQKPAT